MHGSVKWRKVRYGGVRNNFNKYMKRIAIISDLHCGHQFGLAHPEDCVNDVQKRGWDFFEAGLKKYAPYDVVFCNGDAIDGNARKN